MLFTIVIYVEISARVDSSILLNGTLGKDVIECLGFSSDRVNFLPSSCCVLDLLREEC